MWAEAKRAVKLCLPNFFLNPQPCKRCQMADASVFQLNTTYIKYFKYFIRAVFRAREGKSLAAVKFH